MIRTSVLLLALSFIAPSLAPATTPEAQNLNLQVDPPRGDEDVACEGLVAAGVMNYYRSNADFELNDLMGVTPRNFLSSRPARSPESEIAAQRSHAIWWGLQIVPVTSVDAARANELAIVDKGKGIFKYTTTLKNAYMVVPDVSKYEELVKTLPNPSTSPKSEQEAYKVKVRALWQEMAPQARFYYFDDANEKHFELNAKDLLARLSLNEIEITNSDIRGKRFYFWGWSIPPERGVAKFENIFKRSHQRTTTGKEIPGSPLALIADRNIRKSLIELLHFYADGGRAVISTNWQEPLFMAKNQLRAGDTRVTDDNKKVLDKGLQRGGSRYVTDAQAEAVTISRFEQGKAYAINAITAQGVLAAGGITFREGNVYTSDTVYYLVAEHEYTPNPPPGAGPDHPDMRRHFDPYNPQRNYASVAGLMRLAEAASLYRMNGIEIRDVLMVSEFTARRGGELVPHATFREYVKDLRQRPVRTYPIGADGNLELTLEQVMPYDLEDIDTWLDLSKEPRLRAYIDAYLAEKKARQAP